MANDRVKGCSSVQVSAVNRPNARHHPTKSHVVVAQEGDQVKTIRFGQRLRLTRLQGGARPSSLAMPRTSRRARCLRPGGLTRSREPEQDEIELEQMEEGQLMLGGDPMEKAAAICLLISVILVMIPLSFLLEKLRGVAAFSNVLSL